MWQQAGKSFGNTIGKNKTYKHYIKGSKKRIKMIKWMHTDKGKRALARRLFRKSHPLKTNPAKIRKLHGKQKKKMQRKLGIKTPSRKIRKLLRKRN